MKKLFLLSIMLLSVLFVNAQRSQATTESMVQKRVDILTKQLDLTADQQDQMSKLFFNQIQNRKGKGKAKYSEMTPEEKATMRANRKAAKLEFDHKVAQVLTEEQLATYQNTGRKRSANPAKGKRKANRPDKAGGKNAKANKPQKSSEERIQKRVDRMTEELGLNTTQQAQLAELYANKSNKGSKIKVQPRKELSKEQRKVMKKNRKQAKADFDSALAEILSPEQLVKHEASKAERKEKRSKDKKARKANTRKL